MILDGRSAEAHTSLAMARWMDRDWSAAEGEFRRAIELNMDYALAHQWYGSFYLTPLRRFDEALAEVKRAQELDPASLAIGSNLGAVLFYAGRYSEAVEQHRKTLEMDREFWPAHYGLGLVYEQIGRVDAAIAALETAIAAAPTQRSVVAALGHAYARAGRRREARSIADEIGLHSADGYAYDLAIVRAGLGGDDEALDCLERAYRDRLPGLRGSRSTHASTACAATSDSPR